MPIPEAAAAIFAAHAGCASVRQLVTVEGVTPAMVRGWRRRGHTVAVHRGVDRISGAPETDQQQQWAAVLRAGPHARAGPRATLHLQGLEGFREPFVDVVLEAPHRCRGTAFPAPTRALGPADRATVRGFPALSTSRAIVEVAHTLTSKELRVLIDSARRGRLLTVERLARRARALQDEPGCRRGARAVLQLVSSGDLDKESERERSMAAFLQTTTLQLEWQVTDLVPGRRLDAVDRAARLVLEIDSRLWHTLGSDRDADGIRDLEIAEAGDYVVFHLTYGMVLFEPERTRRLLDAIRARRIREVATR